MQADALERLMLRHQQNVYRYLRYLGADAALAEDVTQEAFVAAYENPRHPPLEEERRVGAWLRTIARNQFYSACRRRSREPFVSGEDALAVAETIWSQLTKKPGDYDRQLAALDECLEEVSPRNRAILEARHGEENLSRTELAKRFDMAEEGIKTVLRRVRAALQECIRLRLESEGTA